jgi:hypothetical protein
MFTEIYTMLKHEAAATLSGIREKTAVSEQQYQADVRESLSSSTALVAGRAERLARMNATIAFNADLRAFMGPQFNRESNSSESE